jgi:hypothetical protein
VSVEHVEVLVEEPSAEAALRIILPKILGSLSFQIYPHQCKKDLLDRLSRRLKGYSNFIQDNWRIVILVDRDDDDCAELKKRLEEIVAAAPLVSRSAAGGPPYAVVTRLAIEELEAWYFGDWDAVRMAYPRAPANVPRKASYRVPDAIAGGTWEAFERIMQRAGYFRTGLRKIEAARSIAAHIDPARNSSASFQVLRETLMEMLTASVP